MGDTLVSWSISTRPPRIGRHRLTVLTTTALSLGGLFAAAGPAAADAAPTLIATVTVGQDPQAVAITPDGAHAYVVNTDDTTVSVLNTATNTVSATIGGKTGVYPVDIAVSPDGTFAYLTTENEKFNGKNATNGQVSVIDTATDTVTDVINEVGQYPLFPTAIAISPDGTHLYITNLEAFTLSVVDIATGTVGATAPVGYAPDAVAVTPDGTRAYVTNTESNSVTVLDLVPTP
jgi:YVTN family beta-propeller protein